jgi:hypothetical protein
MRRVAVVVAVVAVAMIAVRVAAPSHASHFHYSAALACGVERWTVKTLQDRPRLLRARTATIGYLVSRPAPIALPATRLPFEYRGSCIEQFVAIPYRQPPDADDDLRA